MLKLLILDLDETLLRMKVDWEKVRAEVIEYGRSQGAAFNSSDSIIPLSSAISSTSERKQEVDSIWRRHELSSMEKSSVVRYAKAEKFVKRMKKRGLLLAIASNNCHASAEKALALSGLSSFFDLMVCRDDVSSTKPHPEMLLKILDSFGIAKEEAVFIGNSETSDAPAGKSAGIRTLIVNPNSAFPQIG
ncbi:MAG: HAD family hydrolase [Candidatus ainarchaeum sp.]|nr:HAD family hydrolase [Candidatus ainarchaeum sp.]